MATRRTTSDKRQRERAKQAKAAAKRAKRQDKGEEPEDEATPGAGQTETTEQLIARMDSLHEAFDAGEIAFEEFDEQKSELLDKIALSLTA